MNREPTGQGKDREVCGDFFKVREKSGNFEKMVGENKNKNLNKSRNFQFVFCFEKKLWQFSGDYEWQTSYSYICYICVSLY